MAAPGRALRDPRTGLALTAVVLLAASEAAAARERLRVLPALNPWIASQYFLDYRDGFVRRALPGALLHLVEPAPGRREALLLMLVLAAAATVALLGLAWCCARLAADRRSALLAAAVVLASPLGVPMVLRDAGRYDAVGIVALALLALRRAPGPLLVAVLLVAATATEELLLLHLALPAWLLLRHRGAVRALLPLVPAVVVAAASALVRPSAATVADVVGRAAAAGFPVTTAPQSNAVVVLRNGLREELDYVVAAGAGQLLLSTAVLGALFALGVVAVQALLGADPRRAPWLLVTGWYAGAALLLTVVGVDHRRWWALSFAGAVATTVVLRRQHDAERPPPAWPWCVVVLSALACDVPLGPGWTSLADALPPFSGR